MDLTTRLYMTNAILAACIFAMIIAINHPKLMGQIAKGLAWSAGGTLILGVALVYKFPQFRDPLGIFNSGAIALILVLASQTLGKIAKNNGTAA